MECLNDDFMHSEVMNHSEITRNKMTSVQMTIEESLRDFTVICILFREIHVVNVHHFLDELA